MTISQKPFNTFFKIFSLLAVIFLSYSFTINNPNYIGTYGVSNDDPSEITLDIHKDGTFNFQDMSNTSKPIKTKGTWSLKRSSIILESNQPMKFHCKWKFSADGTVARSRKGMLFYTLTKLH
jgi:hypothetical protein